MKCLEYHIHNQQTKKLNLEPLPCAKTMAHGKGTNLCRVQKSRHTAKSPSTSPFLEATFFCRGPSFSHGKAFAVCKTWPTEKKGPSKKGDGAGALPCALPTWHTTKFESLPCALDFAHGKEWFLCRVPW